MRMSTTLIAFALLSVAAVAQETIRRAEGPGEFSKYLTPGLLDSWIIEGKQGETIIAHVVSGQFDPVLELARPGDGEDRVMFSIDDQGSESRFATRLPETGEYRIRIHAFKYKGGGNYTLHIRRFEAQPLTVGERLVGTFDRQGKSHVYFPAAQDQILIPELKGAASRSWEMLDGKGRRLSDWSGAVLAEDDGEHSLALSGAPGNRYELLVREARQRDLEGDGEQAGRLEQGEMEVWNFDGKPGEFRLLEVESKGRLASRLIYAPREKPEEQPLARTEKRPELRLLPVASKGGRARYAALLGREGRYQLQLLAESDASYDLNAGDPTRPIERSKEQRSRLPVGGAAFYSFRAEPGQLIEANLTSESFDPQLRLYDSRGDLVEQNDDGGGGLGSRISHMVVREGAFRLQVSSLGDGGGGDFQLTLREQKLNEVQVGGRGRGLLQASSTDFWSFTGQEGKTVLLSVRSEVCDPRVRLHSPDGVQLADDDNGGVGTDSLLAVRLPKTGRYTVWVSSARGVGDYNLRLIDGD